MTSVVAPRVEQALRDAESRGRELTARESELRTKIAHLAEGISAAVGAAPHRRRPELQELRRELAAVHSAASVQARLVAELRVAAGAARCDDRGAEYAALIDKHVAAAVSLAQSVEQLEQFASEIREGGFDFPLPRFLFRDLGGLDDRFSSVRLLLREAAEAGFTIPTTEVPDD